jgi:hypothetical protein
MGLGVRSLQQGPSCAERLRGCLLVKAAPSAPSARLQFGADSRPMGSANTDKAPKAPRQIRRYVVAAASAVALGFAGYCTLASDNEIGTAAAYITGLFFAVIAYTGRVPTIKIGDNQLTPAEAAAASADAVADAVEKAAEKTDDPKEVASAATNAAAVFHELAQYRVNESDPDLFARWLVSQPLASLRADQRAAARRRWQKLADPVDPPGKTPDDPKG